MKKQEGVLVTRRLRFMLHILFSLAIILPTLFIQFSAAGAQSEEIGYRDFPYPRGAGGNSDVTGEKPESKLWWNDGFWYGVLWNTAGNAYHIYRMDLSTHKWIDTGVAVDDRLNTKADALWDGTKLYIVSHIFTENGAVPTPAGQRGELYRYSYQAATKTFTPDSGFPVEVTGGKSETLVIEKDSSGQLWVTYVESMKVMVNHSLNGDDRQWGQPYALPAGGLENVTADDISSLITYNQHIGIMWSNQNSPKTMYFAVHPVGANDQVWNRVRAFSTSGDDHINLKSLETDSAGNVFAVVKTSKSSQLIMLLVCKNNINRCKTETDWVSYPVYNSSSHNPTRPILLIDKTNRHLYVFSRNQDANGWSGIYYKRSSLDNIQFPTGIGTPFIKNSVDIEVNDPTSTKQNLTAQTGLLVLASDTRTKYYLHNFISLGGGSSPPAISGFTPTSGPVGTEVTLTGSNFGQVSAVAFNNTPATSFTIGSNTQIRAVVPDGASTGPIRVSSPNGGATSSASFTLTNNTPQYTLAINVNGNGTVSLNPLADTYPAGSYPAGTVVTLTAQPASGWQFAGWQGGLTGTANPGQVTMNANLSVTAVFSQSTGGGGVVQHQETVTGGAVAAQSVSSSSGITGVGGDLYLAAVSSRNSLTVNSVSGLGLSWTRVVRQCAGRNQTMIEVWMAQGASPQNGVVTANFSSSFRSSVITVSRYTGAHATQPIGNIVSGSTTGVSGACSGGVDSASYSFGIPTTVQGSAIYAAAAMRNRAHTPGSGYTERAEAFAGSAGDVSSVAVQDQANLSAAQYGLNGAFSGVVDWAVIGLEIRPGP